MTSETATATCHLSFHGSAANSSPHSLLWVDIPTVFSTYRNDDVTKTTTNAATTDAGATLECAPSFSSSNHDEQSFSSQINDNPTLVDTVIYASSGVINLATSHPVFPTKTSKKTTTITTVESTLITRTNEHNYHHDATGNTGTTLTDTFSSRSNVAAAAVTPSGKTTKKVLARGEAVEDAAAPRSITALAWIAAEPSNKNRNTATTTHYDHDGLWWGIVSAFSDGTVTFWKYNNHNTYYNNVLQTNEGRSYVDTIFGSWEEHVIIGNDPRRETMDRIGNISSSSTSARTTSLCDYTTTGEPQLRSHDDSTTNFDRSHLYESIADVSGTNLSLQLDGRIKGLHSALLVATASSKGIFLHVSDMTTRTNAAVARNEERAVSSRQVHTHATASVKLQYQQNDSNHIETTAMTTGYYYLFAGSASPRQNKIWIYTISYHCIEKTDTLTTSWVALPFLSIDVPQCHGNLLGHQDWITCLAWLDSFSPDSKDDEDTHKGTDRTTLSLLATSGHDAKIRLWKFSTTTTAARATASRCPQISLSKEEIQENDDDYGANEENDESISDDEINIDDLQEDEGEARLIINHTYCCGDEKSTSVSLEALLMGHEEAVTSLTWRPPRRSNQSDKACLLSSSMDRTILVWMEEECSEIGEGGIGGVWTPITRVGSAGGILGGPLGASLMGFVDAAFSPDSSRIVGHGYGGSIHFWTQTAQKDTISKENNAPEDDYEEVMPTRWVADPCITGHFRSVEDIAWDPNGEYLLSTSSDQTTRLWMQVPISSTLCRWIEVGRPQVHGYDMTSIVCIGSRSDNIDEDSTSEPRHRFVSGADEKVLRVFDAPSSTLRLLQSIKQLRIAMQGKDEYPVGQTCVQNQSSSMSWRVERAFMPSLGLSNKASADTDQESSKYSGPVNDDAFVQTLDMMDGETIEFKLPSERDLGVTTLWPEARKLFGHETELVCLDAYRAPFGSSDSSLVASSCKARNDVDGAAIRLWDANKGSCVGILKGGHRSTVSTMSFSRDGKYLASSGKDRKICIWKKICNALNDSNHSPGFQLLVATDSAHKRIVWSVHFCPERPDILASGSRDGLVKIWHIADKDDGSPEMKEILRFEPSFRVVKEPVTAVSFADELLRFDGENTYGILAVGTESGRIEVWAVPVTWVDSNHIANPLVLHTVLPNDCHFASVKKIAWRPVPTNSLEFASNVDGGLTLASCGQDNGVRIYNLSVDTRIS